MFLFERMQCPNPKCPDPGLVSLPITGENPELCPKCGEVLISLHQDWSDLQEEQKEGRQGKKNEYLQVSLQENSQDTGDTVTQIPLTEGHQLKWSKGNILGSEYVFGTPSAGNRPEQLDMFHHDHEVATSGAKTFYGRGSKRSSPMHESDIDDREGAKRLKNKNEKSDDFHDTERRTYKEIEGSCEFELPVLEEAQLSEQRREANKSKEKDHKFSEDRSLEGCSFLLDIEPDVDQVTIIFHGLLSPSFQFKPTEHRVFIRAGHERLGLSWDCNLVEIYPVGPTKKNFFEIRGWVQLPIGFLRSCIPYKYVVYTSEETFEWECSEFSDPNSSKATNRKIDLYKDKFKNGVWHQYDGVIYPQSIEGVFEWLWNYWVREREWVASRKAPTRDREYAVFTFLPKWKGFVDGNEYDTMTATEALDQTFAVSSLSRVNVSIGHQERNDLVNGFNFSKVLVDFLTPKIRSNANIKKEELSSPPVRVERLVSCLAITILIKEFDLKLPPILLQGIIRCLAVGTSNTVGQRCDFDEIHKHFPKEMWGSLAQAILYLLKAAKTADTIIAVPLLHFLRKDSKPFEEPDVTQELTLKSWCCSDGLPQFKPDKFVKTFLPQVRPMFSMDPLLRRFFLCCTPFEEFKEISSYDIFPVHEICHALSLKLREGKHLSNSVSNSFATFMNDLIQRLERCRSNNQREPDQDSIFCAKSTCFLLEEFRKKFGIKEESFFEVLNLAVVALNNIDQPSHESEIEMLDRKTKEYEVTFKAIWKVVKTGIENELSFSRIKVYEKKKLKVWNTLLGVNFSEEELSKTWRAKIISLFELNTKKLSNKDAIDLFCEVEANEFNDNLVDSIKSHALVVAKRIAETKDEEKCINSLQLKCLKENSSKAGQLLSLVLTHSWSKTMTKTTEDVSKTNLLYILTWKPWQGLLKLYAKVKSSSDVKDMMTDKANHLINQVITQLISIQYALEEGTVDVKRLVLLKKFKHSFLNLCATLKDIEKDIGSMEVVLAEKSVKKSLIKRIDELQTFETLRVEVLEFINICTASKNYASFDFASLDTKANCDISDTLLVELCRRLPQSDEAPDGEIDVVFFGQLSKCFRSMLSQLVVASKSVIFPTFWSKYCKTAWTKRVDKSGGFTLAEVQNKVWKPAIDKLEHLAKETKDGSISLKGIDKNFKKVKDLEKELRILFEVIDVDKTTLDQTVSERASQINLYSSLQNGMLAVETVWEFKESLQLKGNFTIIDELHHQNSKEFKEKRLDSIGENFSHANDFLRVISLENAQCLRAIIDCQPLVIWLRETIKDTSALSTLVDLAMISAGENDLEVDRISNFHTSCLNFASLIFDFDVEIGFTELMTACQSVWKALKDDKQLPTKLYDTHLHLEWLKAVEQSHGSVEMSSLMQTKAINSSGVYRVGHITPEDTTRSIFMSSEKMSLEHVMTLTVPIDQAPVAHRPHEEEKEMRDLTKKEELKKYSLNDLKDLQSKLMLIAGKTAKLQNKECIESTEEINKFVEILEGIMRIGQLYIDLCEAGDDQYLTWSKEVVCSDNRSSHGSVHEEILQSILAMEKRLREWQNDVHEKRRQYKELNHFTAKQILALRRELGLLRRGSSLDVPLQVYTLLESVNVDITSEELISTLKEILGIKIDAAGTEEEESDVELDQSDSHEEMEEDTDRMYLTLDKLGSILVELATTCTKPKPRRLPEYLKVDQPNLVLVDQGEIFPTVLSLYMKYGENTVPTPSEVLVCSPNTTEEEVELFWWRAFGDSSEQIYCLVSPDLLDYNVSQAALNAFSTLKQEFAGTTVGYRILVLCSTQNEDRSHIIAAFDTYRINAPICAPAEHLSDYLRRQFTRTEPLTGYIDEEEIPWIHACSLDPDKLGIRVVSSNRAGVGKSLVVSRLAEKLLELQNNHKVMESKEHEQIKLAITVPLHRTVVNTCAVLDALWQNPVRANLPVSRLIHLDVSPSVTEGLEYVLFNLLVLGVLSDSNGRLWRRRATDLYVVEMTKLIKKPSNTPPLKTHMSASFISLLPTITCVTPKETLDQLKMNKDSLAVPLFDEQEYRRVPVNRVFQYLQKYDTHQNLDRYHFTVNEAMGSPDECLQLIIKYCGIKDPSWSELKHFIDFLNSQLQDCEESTFCNAEHMDDTWMEGTLPGFKSFVVHFMVTMSRDFATPSLENNVTFTPESSEHDNNEDIRPLKLRRRWESSAHPYIFFNKDGITMTFLGFHVDDNGNLIDPDTSQLIERGLMTSNLRRGLHHQGVGLQENYANWDKRNKIQKLCAVLGVPERPDPDPTYVLTIDNMKKILAIHMRFRCGIPVVIMGETGCGKTRLIQYMCALQAGINGPRNMLVMKVHGGTSFKDICRKVKQAEEMARRNEEHQIDTVLFFDEANTTDALPMIKEVMVDRRINGQPVGEGLQRLHFIAACNPYRRHSNRMIEKLESAGLGYSVKADKTKERLGKIPLRHLVYRVHSLPESIRPLVWDFGQLRPETEERYICEIVSRYVRNDQVEKTIPGNGALIRAISAVLSAAQRHMREQQDECSFVSLRDVERAMTIMTWFYEHHSLLRPQATSSEKPESDDEKSENEDKRETQKEEGVDRVTWSLLLSLGVCYHAKLRQRSDFRRNVVSACELPLKNNINEKQMNTEILRCQKVLIEELNLGPNIARNTALSENVFMMVVCIELRIPLFVIGKPGSSKSLAKTVVADNMQGDASKSQLFKTFKRAHMVSYQCSPLSTPEGIVATFRQCRRLQDNNPDGRYASVVVLDEVGLAEDSPLMPLKTLHPLLEDGVTSSDDFTETNEKPTRVAFIGISNWALDPAKMNRGLMLVRAEPSMKELEDSARGICAEREDVQTILSSLLNKLAAGYADLYRKQKKFESLRQSGRDEFFGLRDFYSLVKMVYSIAAQKGRKPNWKELERAIRRNFGGLDEINAVEIFRKRVTCGSDEGMQEREAVNTLDLLTASLDRKNTIGESRYLLVLTENYSALRIVEQQLNKNKEDYVVIFGSSFPKDQEYTQVCRNINQIKVCMETGRTVILLNLEKLYESLYDVLNQYYVYCADQKYVDLGLGSHRVKCRVDNDFRLIVVAEKDVVYEKFPIPLINRLEKHYLVTSKSLDQAQLDIVKVLKEWARNFASAKVPRHKGQKHFEIGDAFVGYHDDTIPSMVLQVCSDLGYGGHLNEENVSKIMDKCKNLLIKCATPDAIARLSNTAIKDQVQYIQDVYFKKQEHTSLVKYLENALRKDDASRSHLGLLAQVSTHSRMLSENDMTEICKAAGIKHCYAKLLTLQQFQTEQQFIKQVRDFLQTLKRNKGILLVQCDSSDENFNLLSCSRHLLMGQRLKRAENQMDQAKLPPVNLVIIAQLPRVKGGCKNFVGFQGGMWESVHIDDLCPPTIHFPPIECLLDQSISDLLKPEVNYQDIEMEEVVAEENPEREDAREETENRKEDTVMEVDDDDDDVAAAVDDDEQTPAIAFNESNAHYLRIDTEAMETNESAPGQVSEEKVQPEHKHPGDHEVHKRSRKDAEQKSQNKVDVVVLLRKSIQSAAGRLRDHSSMLDRTTERINILLKLLPENYASLPVEPSFARILHSKIHELLEKKNKIAGHLAFDWVHREALEEISVHEHGTFVKALHHRILSEIEPLVAKVLVCVDRDCNLDLLCDSKNGPWISRLWNSIFDNDRLCKIFYDPSKSASTHEQVAVSGRGRHAFRCRFPFSWLIKSLIDDLMRGASDVSSHSKEQKLRNVLESSELSQIFKIIIEEGKQEVAVRRYLHDFVHIVYKPTSDAPDKEIELVSNAILMDFQKRSEEKVALDFAAIHVTYDRIQARINNFHQLIKAEPTLRQMLSSSSHPLGIDVAGLLACLETLEPRSENLDTNEHRNQWCGRVLNVRKTIETMTSKDVFSKTYVETERYEEEEKELLKKIWLMWQRLNVVRLFIDDVCNACRQLNDNEITQYVNKLWKVLGEDPNFLKATYVQRLERFLLDCSYNLSRRNKCSDAMTCPICGREVELPSVAPCGHCTCLECATRCSSEHSTCPKCRAQFPADYVPSESKTMRNAIENVKEFRNHCNSYFMEVVSLFCFGYSPCGSLEDDTFRLLMSFATGDKGSNTKSFSPFPDYGVDSTPVVRSFLLQQLLRSSDKQVKKYMDDFITKARSFAEVQDVKHAVEVFVMCVQCMEDAISGKFAKETCELFLDQKLRLITKDCKTAFRLFYGEKPNSQQALSINWLEGIARSRVVLSLSAELMYQRQSEQDEQKWSHPDVKSLFSKLLVEVRRLCLQDPSTVTSIPRLFLLKQLSRKYGFESINNLAQNSEFDWILPPEAKASVKVTQDRFLVYGIQYQELREMISRSLVSRDMSRVENKLKEMKGTVERTSAALLLGIFQEVTADRHVTPIARQNLEKFLLDSECLTNKARELALELISETQSQNSIKSVYVMAGKTPWDTSMLEIVTHLAAVLFSRENDDLLGPLVSLALRPDTMNDSFLPTMPEDPLEYVRASIAGGSSVLYECENGHPYLVTECGKPTESSRCREPGCGKAIGGLNHRLTSGNRAAPTNDQTSKGHVLGSLDRRERDPTPEREMTSLGKCLLRLLVHGSMLIGSCYRPQCISQLISPSVRVESLQEFLWKHAIHDMRLLSTASGRSVDDTALVVHFVLQKASGYAQSNQGRYRILPTKEKRKEWEIFFSTDLIQPVMPNLENRIRSTVELIVNDKRFGSNPLLCQLYELESSVEDYTKGIQTNCVALWRFRTTVTISHVIRTFSESDEAIKSGCVVLEEFLKKERELRAIKYLPDVVKLQRFLLDHFHRTLDKTELNTLKLRKVYRRLTKDDAEELISLVQSFRSALALKSLSEKGTSEVFILSVDEDSPVSFFVPTSSAAGNPSLDLVRFLVDTQNKFLKFCSQKLDNITLTGISLLDVTNSELVSYDTDRNLIPLVLAHCRYSIQAGHGTLVEYNWPAVQKQIIDRLIRGRMLIDFEEKNYEQAVVQVTVETVLTNLKSKIAQVELSVAIKNQILQQYRSLEDVCEALSSLNTAITFLASGGGNPAMPISEYIQHVLMIPEESDLHNTKAQEVCRLQHSISLWRLLTIQRAKILTRRGQDPFEQLPSEFKARLEDKSVGQVWKDSLEKLSKDAHDFLVSILLDLIVLHLKDNMDIGNSSLKTYIEWYMDEIELEHVAGVNCIPYNAKLKHIVEMWKIAVTR